MYLISIFKILSVVLFMACFVSFIWAMLYFFKSTTEKTSVWLKLIKYVGGTATALHFFLLIEKNTLLSHYLVALFLYSISLCVFWFSIAAHKNKPPALCFNSDVPENFVTTGTYRFIRHPFYTSYILAWIAGVVATNTYWLILSVLIMSWLYLKAAITEEESFKNSIFAKEYETYREMTGMFFPLKIKLLKHFEQ